MSEADANIEKRRSYRKRSDKEYRTLYVREKIIEHARFVHGMEVKQSELSFLAEDGESELWKIDISEGDPLYQKGRIKDEIIFFWNGYEVESFYDTPAAIRAFINQMQLRSHVRFWQFLSSPLIISGIIGILLIAMTFYSIARLPETPTQMWTILTAVVAFYFGRGGSSPASRRDGE
jgi:hypothetical protein